MKKLSLINFIISLAIIIYLLIQILNPSKVSLDDVKQFILDNPKVLIDSLEGYRKQMDKSELKSVVDEKQIFSGVNDPRVGNPNAKIKIVEFFDYSCGYCHKMFLVKKKLLEANKDIEIISKETPMLSERSVLLSKASLAAYKADSSKYMAYQEVLFDLRNKQTLNVDLFTKLAVQVGIKENDFKKAFDDEEKHASVINDNAELAGNIGLRGTPAYVIGNEIIPGYISYEDFNTKIANRRKAIAG